MSRYVPRDIFHLDNETITSKTYRGLTRQLCTLIKTRRGRPKSVDPFSHNRNFFLIVRERVDRFWSTLARFSQCKKLARKSPVGFRSFCLVTAKNRKNMKSPNFRLSTRKTENFSTLSRKTRKFSSLDSKKPKKNFRLFRLESRNISTCHASKVENCTGG